MSEVVSDAIVRIIGYRDATFPQSNEIALDPSIRAKVDEVFSFVEGLAPDWTVLNLATSGEWAKVQIARKFPTLLPEALDALAWDCTFGWK